jgi:hypothetical protein
VTDSPARGRSRIYPARRALEHAARLVDVRPVRLLAVLLPVWQAEVRAHLTEASDYELIDRFVERAIEDCGITSRQGLADFFGLDRSLVDRVVDVLAAIGHLTDRGDALALSPLGRRSRAEGVRYVTRTGRLRLLFEAITHSPLRREHYAASVTRVDQPELGRDALHDGTTFVPLWHCSWRQEMVNQLATQPSRDAYNLPSELRVDTIGEVDGLFMPVYIVRAALRDGSAHYLAFSQVRGERDPLVESICNTNHRMRRFLQQEEERDGRDPMEVWRGWLLARGFDTGSLRRLPNGVLRADLPASAMAGATTTGLGITQLGSFWMEGGLFLNLWCRNRDTRRTAALERGLLVVSSSLSRDEVQDGLDVLCQQLEVPSVSVDELRAHADRRGRTGLARILDSLRAYE